MAIRRAPAWFLAAGDGPKLGFGDENPEINLGLDSSSSALVR